MNIWIDVMLRGLVIVSLIFILIFGGWNGKP